MKILAFGASNSLQSINQQFAIWAAQQAPGATVETLSIHDYELPIYSPEREKEMGQPALVQSFLSRIREADALVISFAEHNGSYTAAWKNLSDWLSRTERKFLYGKPVLLLATSIGAGGAKGVLQQAQTMAKYINGDTLDAISLPEFHAHYDMPTQQVRHPDVVTRVQNTMQELMVSWQKTPPVKSRQNEKMCA